MARCKAIKKVMIGFILIFLAVFTVKPNAVGRKLNIMQEVAGYTVETAVEVSHPSGYYNAPFELEIAAPENLDIFYTLDCSSPTRESLEYKGPIQIRDASANENVFIKKIEGFENKGYKGDKAAIVRAALFDGNEKIGTDIILTYFVDMENREIYAGLPVLSVVLDPDDLFHDDTGIYVTGTLHEEYPENLVDTLKPANYSLKGKIVERACYVDYFKEKFQLEVSQNMGIRIRGGGSRECVQKGFNLYARPEYGASAIGSVFAQNDEEGLSSLAIMTDYDDETKIKIPLGVELAEELAFGTVDCFPCNVFLNGEYWGIYYISERYTEDYFKRNYGIDENNLIMIKKNLNGTCVEIGEEGDIKAYNELLDFVRTHDMSLDENYGAFEKLVDMDSLTDYYCFECCISNRDWPWNNYALWRSKEQGEEKYNDGKWRFLLFDTNNGSCWGATWSGMNIYEKLDGDELIMCLLQNEQFRQRFITRLCDIFNIILEQDNVRKVTDSYVVRMKDSYVQDAMLFHKDYENTDMEQAVKNEIGEYVYLKRDILFQQTKETLHIEEETADFALVMANSDLECMIKVNNLPVDLSWGSWVGSYFAGCPVELEILTDHEFMFHGWEVSIAGETEIVRQKKMSFIIPAEGITIRVV